MGFSKPGGSGGGSGGGATTGQVNELSAKMECLTPSKLTEVI